MVKINMKRESRCRKNIATFLSLMGFHDDDPERTIEVMLGKLREIKRKESQKKLSPIPKIVFKCGGSKASVVSQEHPTMAPLKPQISETLLAGDDDMKSDSRNVSTRVVSEAPCSKTLVMKKIVSKNKGGNMGKDSRNHDEKTDDVCMELKEFIRNMGGSQAKLVIEKELTRTDVTSNQGRLLIPAMQVKNPDFLTIDEEEKLGDKQQQKKESISVLVFDPERRKHTLNLAQWNMNNKNYVLKTNWNQVVSANGLKEKMVIRVLSFRVDQQLCFAIVVVGRKPR